MIRLATLLALGGLAVASVGVAASPPRAADLEAEIVCPVCQTTLDQSNAPIAERMYGFRDHLNGIPRTCVSADLHGSIRYSARIESV